eukprot:g18730.t1
MVYELRDDSTFGAMRDRKVPPMGVIPRGEMFTVYEVLRGAEYGFCFGRIKYKGQESPTTWVVLGLLIERGALFFPQRNVSTPPVPVRCPLVDTGYGSEAI